ncbi:trans-aconitate 2-methyltransferase [Henriciella sp.]|uniref:class I SAM-dependent methyltransferase n=1 Tax=Henriciella sp. TaxID=1968823 RepID=UPI000C0DA033|nr:class I SAM-dependent methyltransferase [Henriciella sp.]PHR81063.1 MAG: hypothetical protein COA64_03145 [Henriciella sp.]
METTVKAETPKERLAALGGIVEFHPKDSMFHGHEQQYFSVGESALSCVKHALDIAGKKPEDVRQILDYACGFGRVARWLKAYFPEAEILGVDADTRAVECANDILGINAERVDLTMKKDMGGPFDLVWMGSLITHLLARDTMDVLAYIHRHLASDGIFVGTMHGIYVYNRIRNGQKLYGLPQDQVDRLLHDYDMFGYGYGHYPHVPTYGISVWNEDMMRRMLGETGFELLDYVEKGWADHQDVFIVRKA